MQFLKRVLMSTGAVALVAMFLNLAAPKSVHAIVATLVDVVNTAASPAITQDVHNLASQIVTLNASISAGSFTKVSVFYQVLPQGGMSATSYVTPSKQSLVITSIEFAPTAGSGNLAIELLNGFAIESYEQWNVSAGSITDLQYPAGIVIGPNVAPIVVPNGGSASAAFNVYLHGYLTAL